MERYSPLSLFLLMCPIFSIFREGGGTYYSLPLFLLMCPIFSIFREWGGGDVLSPSTIPIDVPNIFYI